MLPIDLNLMKQIVGVLSSIHEGLQEGYLTVNLPDEELAKQVHQHLDRSLSDLHDAIEIAVLCEIVGGLAPGEPEAPTPTMDNIVIFPNVTPEA